jgi:hypothetical protein
MAKTGYQAVALDPAVAKSLRGVAHYWSMTTTQRVTLSDAAQRLIEFWADTVDLDPTVRAAIAGTPQPAGQQTLDDAQR